MALKGLKVLATGLALAAMSTQSVLASGDFEPTPWYIDSYGGGPGDMARVHDGHVGVLLARAPAPQLLMAWRSLHRLKVGQTVGKTLHMDCCTPAQADPNEEGGAYGWLTARKRVPGLASYPEYVDVEVMGSNYAVYANCLPDAFNTARDTLKARIAEHGLTSPDVRVWLDGQDVVFKACADGSAPLPALPANAPAWLRADRTYQEAAFALYAGDNVEAAARFAAIARDRASPWAAKGLYLEARALRREALEHPSTQSAARARKAIDALAAAPEGTYGKMEVRGLRRALDYREQPKALLAQLDREMNEAEPKADMAVAFRDYRELGRQGDPEPELSAWINALKTWRTYDDKAGTKVIQARDEAVARWKSGHDPAWLLAALALTQPGDQDASALAAAAAAIPAGDPAWLTAQYHQIRLTIAAGADPAALRARLDAILARQDLTANDRALFLAERTQVASNLADFVRLSVRRPICSYAYSEFSHTEMCGDESRTRGIYSAMLPPGFGEEAQAIIDRLPLAERMTLGATPALPAPLRLDVDLTSYARAVQLQDNAAINLLAQRLAGLMPLMRADWKRIAVTPPGPEKRFAELFAMAKIPGLTTDLASLIRPEGRRIVDYQGDWRDWLILPRGHTMGPQLFPDLRDYGPWGAGAYVEPGDDPDQGETDLSCLGECGPGAFPLHLPPFAQARLPAAQAQRDYFVLRPGAGGDAPAVKFPAGTLIAWEDFLAYAKDHPRDPRAPEALYWLTHITRWGVSQQNRLGYRAFTLLHARYPASEWAKKAKYYYD